MQTCLYSNLSSTVSLKYWQKPVESIPIISETNASSRGMRMMTIIECPDYKVTPFPACTHKCAQYLVEVVVTPL